MPEPQPRRHILQKQPIVDEHSMTSLSRIGIAGVLAAVAAAVIYLAAFSGGSGGPAGGSSVSGQARAEKLFAGLTNSQQFKAAGGGVGWDSAEALGDEGVLIRNLTVKSKDWDGRPTVITAAEVRVRRIDWDNVSRSPYGDVEIDGLAIDSQRVAAFMAATGVTEFVADLKVRWDYKAEGRIVDLQTFDLTVRKWGTIGLQAQLHGLEAAALQDMQNSGEIDPAYAMGLMAEAKIGSLSLSFADGGAIDLLAAKRAADTGLTRKQVIDQALREMEFQKAARPYAIVRQAFDALIVLVKTRGTIALKAAPKQPVPLLRLLLNFKTTPAGVDRLVRDLGLSITAR